MTHQAAIAVAQATLAMPGAPSSCRMWPMDTIIITSTRRSPARIIWHIRIAKLGFAKNSSWVKRMPAVKVE